MQIHHNVPYMVQPVSLAQFVFSSCKPMLIKFFCSSCGVHRVSHQGITELYCHLQQEDVEHGTIGNAELITKSCWRDLLSDEFSMENIDQLRYMKQWRSQKKEFIYIHVIVVNLLDEGHYTMKICSKFAR